MIRASLALVAAMMLWPGAPAVAESQCGPFGDRPAQVQRGIYAGFVSAHNPVCYRGAVLGPWRDSSGTDRYACLYDPRPASSRAPLPLVVFLHGSIATADSILVTGLTRLTATADLGGRAPGFILLAPEGRYTTHYYPGPDDKGLGWDNWYRQLNPSGDVTLSGTTYAENADAAALDHFIDEQLSTGKVDPKRIYVMGWSNGAAMAILYALNRPKIAAAAVYAAPNPFGAFDDPCAQKPVARPAASQGEIQVFNPRVPIMHVRNACDIGGICPNGTVLTGELLSLGSTCEDVIIDASGDKVGGCEAACGSNPMADGDVSFWGGARGAKNHLFWPKRWTDRMLEFLKAHPLGGS